MSHNTFGHLFRVTTWGESHGPAIGCVVDGCPPGLSLTAEFIQQFLDKRKPGTSRFVTQRQEEDLVKILSGVFEDDRTGGPVTTGTPISLMIENTDQRSKDYGEIRDSYRPGHADYAYDQKYGVRDYRGGGRSSARETASRVAAGAVARMALGAGITIRGAVVQIGPHAINRDNWNWDVVEQNPFWCPDAEMAPKWEAFLDATRKAGSSCGAIIEVVAEGVPPGWGAPIYGKLDSEIAARDDEHQRREGRRDRRGLRIGRALGRGQCRRDAPVRTMAWSSCPTTMAACSAAFPPDSRLSRASP